MSLLQFRWIKVDAPKADAICTHVHLVGAQRANPILGTLDRPSQAAQALNLATENIGMSHVTCFTVQTHQIESTFHLSTVIETA